MAYYCEEHLRMEKKDNTPNTLSTIEELDTTTSNNTTSPATPRRRSSAIQLIADSCNATTKTQCTSSSSCAKVYEHGRLATSSIRISQYGVCRIPGQVSSDPFPACADVTCVAESKRAEVATASAFVSDRCLCTDLDILSSRSLSVDFSEPIELNVYPDFRCFFGAS